MIAYVDEGSPKVEIDALGVAVWVNDDGADPHGLMLPPPTALETALRMIGTVAELDDTLVIRPEAVSFDVGLVGPELETAFRVMFSVRGAPFAIELSPAQLEGLIDGLQKLSRCVDPKVPGRVDRARRD